MPKARLDPDRPPCEPGCKGEDHPRCKGHKRNRQPCGQSPMENQKVCAMHGGKTPVSLAAAERRGGELVAKRAMATYGLPVQIDPGAALLEEVARSAGHVRWLSEVVAELVPESLVWGQKQWSHEQGVGPEGPIDKTTRVESAATNAWLDLYFKERDHLRKVASDAIKAGIAERQVRLAEQAGERAGQWLRATLAVLDLTDQQMRSVMAEGVRHLHILEGAA